MVESWKRKYRQAESDLLSQISGSFCYQTLDLITRLTYWILSLWSWLLWPESESRANSAHPLWTWYSNVKSLFRVHKGFVWLSSAFSWCCKILNRTFLGSRPGTKSKYARVTRPLPASDWSMAPMLVSDWLTLPKAWSPWHHSLLISVSA